LGIALVEGEVRLGVRREIHSEEEEEEEDLLEDRKEILPGEAVAHLAVREAGPRFQGREGLRGFSQNSLRGILLTEEGEEAH
jgi:hypothetical protein